MDELRRTSSDEVFAFYRRMKPFVFAIDPRMKQTVYMERHEWESDAPARMINADASPYLAFGCSADEHPWESGI